MLKSATSIGEQRILSAGESVRGKIDAEGDPRLDTLDAEHHFVRQMPYAEPRVYAKAVLADKPLFYWTFDEPAGPVIEHVRRLPFHSLYPHGAGRCTHTSIDSGLALGRAADFSKDAGAFASGRLGYSDSLPGAWAIEFWAQPVGKRTIRTGQYIMNAGLFGRVDRYANTNPAVIFNWPKNAAENELQLLSFQSGMSQTQSGPILDDTHWRHMILVYYGNDTGFGVAPRVDVVVDGQRNTIDRCNFTSGFNLSGQVWFGAEGYKLEYPFCGRLDELAIYDLSGLTEADIESRITNMARRHFNAAQRKGGE